jgi:hypothetical protein
LTYCLLGDKRHALDLLLTAVAKHEARATSVLVEHNLQALHDDSTFRKRVAQVGPAATRMSEMKNGVVISLCARILSYRGAEGMCLVLLSSDSTSTMLRLEK